MRSDDEATPRPANLVCAPLKKMLAAKKEQLKDDKMKSCLLLLRTIIDEWKQEQAPRIRLSEAVAILAARRGIAWDPKRKPYDGLIRLCYPGIDKGRKSELLRLLEKNRGMTSKKLAKKVEKKGGVDKAYRSLSLKS